MRIDAPLQAAASAVELRQLRAMLAVVEHGSISAAASALGIAQSTVSEALASLERAIGVPVLLRKRGARVMALTDAGTALLPHARRILQEIDAMHAAMARVSSTAVGHMRISANESVSTYVLGPALSVLRKQWPHVRFSVTVGTCPVVRDSVAQKKADLGLLLEEQGARAATTSEAATQIIVAPAVALTLFARRDHPLHRRGSPCSASELSPFLIYVADSAGDFHDSVIRFFTIDGMPAPRLESAGSIEGVKRAVADDRTALGVLPSYAVADDLAKGPLEALTLRRALPEMRLVAHMPSEATAHPSMHALLAELRSASLPLATTGAK